MPSPPELQGQMSRYISTAMTRADIRIWGVLVADQPLKNNSAHQITDLSQRIKTGAIF